MNNIDHNIEDLARLAREACAYRGRSQEAEASLRMPTAQQNKQTGGSLNKLISFLKHH